MLIGFDIMTDDMFSNKCNPILTQNFIYQR